MEQNKKRILICGADGYIGEALFEYLSSKGFEVFGVDNHMRERNVVNSGSASLTWNKSPAQYTLDISTNYKGIKELIEVLRPSTIVNLAQQPSAPWSFSNIENAGETQRNNLVGNLNILWAVKEVDPTIRIIQLGTAGEFPDWLYPDGMEVPEGSRVTVQRNGKDWTIPTPKYGGSFYHLSKTYSSFNSDYACKIWGLSITDINQGIVYGHYGNTRFDYDEYFGTVVNRFLVQAVAGIPLTIYGKSGGQMRSFINILNSLQSIELLINNPADIGEFRTVLQLTELYRVRDIANMIKELTNCEIQFIDNPRAESDENTFSFENKKLKTLGLETISMKDELPRLLELVRSKKDNIIKEVIMPKTRWS